MTIAAASASNNESPQADTYIPDEPPQTQPVATVAPPPLWPQVVDTVQQVAGEAKAQWEAEQSQKLSYSSDSSPSYSTPSAGSAGGSDAKMQIYQRESGNDPYAVNPSSGACGLCQANPCSKMGCALGDYACQDNWCEMYMAGRYGTWEAAWGFWQANHWW